MNKLSIWGLSLIAAVCFFFEGTNYIRNTNYDRLNHFVQTDIEKANHEVSEKLGCSELPLPVIQFFKTPYSNIVGNYHDGIIYLSSSLRAPLFPVFYTPNNRNIHEILRHELGHYYFASLRKKDAISIAADRNPTVWFVIDEGVAKYCEFGYLPHKDQDFMRLVIDPDFSVKAMGGHYLVAPILRDYGCKGLEAIANSPLPNNLSDLEEYQENIIKKLNND